MKQAEKIETLEVVSYEEKAFAEYHITPEEVALKAKEYLALKVIPEDEASYKVARAAHTSLVRLRTTGDKRRKTLGEDARAWMSAVNDAYKKLFSPLLPAEEHLQNELHLEDGRKAEVKAKKAAEEATRVAGIRAKIDTLGPPSLVVLQNAKADDLHEMADAILHTEITKEVFGEFFDEAITARLNSFQALCDAEQARRTWEKEEAERKIEAERLARQKADQDATEKAQAEERRKIKEVQDKLDAEKKVEQDRKLRERLEADIKKKVEADARAKVEREEKERKTKEEAEAKEKAEREALEAAEKTRKEALRPDKEKLIAYGEALLSIPSPILSSNQARRVLADVNDGLDHIMTLIKVEVEAL